jgi:hypothetical protein
MIHQEGKNVKIYKYNWVYTNTNARCPCRIYHNTIGVDEDAVITCDELIFEGSAKRHPV